MKFAWNGFLFGIRTERNVQITVIISIVTILIGLILKISKTEMLILLLWVFGVGTAEYLNTAIEKLGDRVTKDYDEQIKHVKDLSAAATMILSIGAVVSCLLIFIPKVVQLFECHA